MAHSWHFDNFKVPLSLRTGQSWIELLLVVAWRIAFTDDYPLVNEIWACTKAACAKALMTGWISLRNADRSG